MQVNNKNEYKKLHTFTFTGGYSSFPLFKKKQNKNIHFCCTQVDLLYVCLHLKVELQLEKVFRCLNDLKLCFSCLHCALPAVGNLK